MFYIKPCTYLVAAGTALILMLPGVPSASAHQPAGYRLMWHDEFTGKTLDAEKWVYWLPGIRRDATNVPAAVSVKDGCLNIATYSVGNIHNTGMISTENKFGAGPGYYEARIKFHDAPGMWSAFWLQTPSMARPLGNPAVAGAEIDICEHRSQDQNTDINGQIQTNIHWDGYGSHAKSSGSGNYGQGLGEGFHIYGLLWTSTNYQFYVDGKLGYATSAGLSQRAEFIILSSEVDDTSTKWAGKIPASGYGSLADTQTRMLVDYIRYYAPPSSIP